ncbi:hypothetical protein [Salipaludibacillus sp. CF4.18]|uniref:hypothetical protein n=1 Tax=Salipaludibacillus sp. CF4.18 TaxID=3373081 RepID=UPI003EE53076
MTVYTIPWKSGSSHYYVITAVLVREENEESMCETNETHKKRNDTLIARFLKRV